MISTGIKSAVSEEDQLIQITKGINTVTADIIDNINEEEGAPKSPKRGRGRPPKSSTPPPPVIIENKKPSTSNKSLQDLEIPKLKFKISCLLNSKFIQDILPNEIRNMPENNYAQCMEKLKTIQSSRNLAFKKTMVGKLFFSVCGLLEEGTKYYLPYMEGFSEDISQNKEMFESDIEELAIDLDDKYIPGPSARILVSLCILMNERRSSYYAMDPRAKSNVKSILKNKLKEEEVNTDDNRGDNKFDEYSY